jgi:RNA-splicing ligase RtcB
MWDLIHNNKSIAKVFCSNYEYKVIEQLKQLSERPDYKYIVAFPDLHAGEYPVGYVMRTGNTIYFDLTGADIGCNVRVVKIAEDITDLVDTIGQFASDTFTGRKASPSLGGGNHFIEIGQDSSGAYYISVHTGSRALGGDLYKKIAKELCALGLHGIPYNSQLGKMFMEEYRDTVRYAADNSFNIIATICDEFELIKVKEVYTVHNTIKVNSNCIDHYKGASVVYSGSQAAIPISMGKGIVLVTALNATPLFNGLPHGAGRRLSRSEANRTLTSEALKNINYIANKSVLDEAPEAYKDITADLLELEELGYIKIDAHVSSVLTVKE